MEEERPQDRRERLKQLLVRGKGAALGERQLLALALGYAVPGADVFGLSNQLLDRFGTLDGVLSASDKDLADAAGLPREALTLLRLLSLVARREEGADLRPVLSTVEEQVDYLRPLFLRQRRERLYLLCLDAADRLLACEFLGEGSDCVVHLDAELVRKFVRRSGAQAVVLAHSHPSGMALPSQEDISSTRSCRSDLAELGVDLLDHLIFTDEDCVSLAESGLL